MSDLSFNEEQNAPMRSRRPNKGPGGLIGFLIKTGLVTSKTAAQKVLFIIFIIAILLIFFVNRPTHNPADDYGNLEELKEVYPDFT